MKNHRSLDARNKMQDASSVIEKEVTSMQINRNKTDRTINNFAADTIRAS